MEGIRLVLLTRIHLRTDPRPGEPEPGGAELHALRCLYKLEERRDGKGELTEEPDVKHLEAGGADPTKKGFQICINTSEPKPIKIQECYVGCDWHFRQLTLDNVVWNRE